jgi:hypothetical protein
VSNRFAIVAAVVALTAGGKIFADGPPSAEDKKKCDEWSNAHPGASSYPGYMKCPSTRPPKQREGDYDHVVRPSEGAAPQGGDDLPPQHPPK